MHVMDSSCAPILRVFSAVSDGPTANRQIPDRLFWPFFTSLMKDSFANYGSILTHFQPSVRGLNVLYNALNVSYFLWQVAPQDSQMCCGNFPERKKSASDLCQMLRIITIEVVINSTSIMGIRVSINILPVSIQYLFVVVSVTSQHVKSTWCLVAAQLMIRWNFRKQEAQLMLTTGSTRLPVSRGQQTWYNSTCHIQFPIVQQ